MRKSCVILVLVFLFFGCGKDKVRPSADSLLTREALNNINTIKTAYQEKDRDILKNYLNPVIGEDILKELFFEKAELSFSLRIVRINGQTVKIDLNWHGIWIVSGKEIKNRGVSTFVFEGSPTKLIRVEGNNPFQTPD